MKTTFTLLTVLWFTSLTMLHAADVPKPESPIAGDVHPVTQQIVLGTWGATLRLFAPERTITFKDARPYKARWMP